MASNTLTGSSPASTLAQLLHIGTGTLPGGAPVRLGDGTLTKLTLRSNGIGIDGINLSRAAGTDARSIVFPDADGTLAMSYEVLKATDQTNNTVTAAAISGLTAALLPSSQYEFEAMLILQSAATTTGVQLRVTGPEGQTAWVIYEIIQPTTNTLVTTNTRRQYFTGWDQNFAAVDAPAAVANFPVWIRGMVRTTSSTPVVGLGLSFNSEVGASTVTVVAGSMMRTRKVG